MLHIIMNVIGMALFVGIYAYALSTEPLPGGNGRLRPPSLKGGAFTAPLCGSAQFRMAP